MKSKLEEAPCLAAMRTRSESWDRRGYQCVSGDPPRVRFTGRKK